MAAMDHRTCRRQSETVAKLGGLDIFEQRRRRADAARPGDQPGHWWRAGRNMRDVWDEQLAQNLRSTFLGTKVAVRTRRPRGGSIVNIASIAGLRPPTLPAYAAAKAGVICFHAAPPWSTPRQTSVEHLPGIPLTRVAGPGGQDEDERPTIWMPTRATSSSKS
jgi:hypothetical protein